MSRRHPLPKLWLMTDERQGDALWAALERLPRGSGVVVRHYSLDRGKRRELVDRIARVTRRQGLLLVVSGTAREAAAARAGGVHGRAPGGGFARSLVRTAPVHSAREIVAAKRARADLLFVSPVFPTRSHPGASSLGRVRFGLLAKRAGLPVIALGGMTPRRAKTLRAFGTYGWAAIDAFGVRI